MANGRLLTIKRERLWRVRFVLEALLRRGVCSSPLLQAVAGHVTWACMLRCESLMILDKTYAFIHSAAPPGTELWDSVRRELWTVR